MRFPYVEHDNRSGVRSGLVLILLTTIIGYAIGLFQFVHLHSTADTSSERVAVEYCQDARCDEEVVRQILAAKRSVYFAVYTITRPSIVDAIVGAKLRGLDVRGITDANQAITAEEKPELNRMRSAGIPIEIPQKQDGLMHMKLLVTDNGYVSGSFNWTTAATSYNDEVIESGSSGSIRDGYAAIFSTMWRRYADGPDV